VEASAERLPFEDASFDALTVTYLLRYVDDPGATLAELARVVRLGGTMASLEFAVPAGVWRPLWGVYVGAVLPAAGRIVSPAWHLSYVVIGACLAPHVSGARLALTVAAFFLGLGVGAHALDELNGRPLQTRIPTVVLSALAACSLAGASAIGIAVAVTHDLWLLAFVAFGAFIATAYNLELFGGLFHNGFWLASAWGAFPVLTAYFAMTD